MAKVMQAPLSSDGATGQHAQGPATSPRGEALDDHREREAAAFDRTVARASAMSWAVAPVLCSPRAEGIRPSLRWLGRRSARAWSRRSDRSMEPARDRALWMRAASHRKEVRREDQDSQAGEGSDDLLLPPLLRGAAHCGRQEGGTVPLAPVSPAVAAAVPAERARG